MKCTFENNEYINSAMIDIRRIMEFLYQEGFSRGVAFQMGLQGAEREDEVESDIDENWYSDEYRRIGEDERDETKE
jgi:hypothetical protein